MKKDDWVVLTMWTPVDRVLIAVIILLTFFIYRFETEIRKQDRQIMELKADNARLHGILEDK